MRDGARQVERADERVADQRSPGAPPARAAAAQSAGRAQSRVAQERRAGNLIGWMLLGVGAGEAIMSLASAYAVLGLTHPGTLPAPDLAGLLAEWCFVPIFAGVSFVLMLFPSGRLPSPRWRPFAGLGLLATALAMVGFVVRPRMVRLPAPGGTSLTFPNPLGIKSIGPVPSTVLIGTLNSLSVLGTVLLAAAFVSLVIRYRSGGREVRQQIKWITLAAVAGAICQTAALLAIAATGSESNPVTITAYIVIPVIALAAVGGTLRIRSEPGLGTTVSGRLPVSELAETRR